MQKGKEGEEAEKHRGGGSAPPVAWVPPRPRQGPHFSSGRPGRFQSPETEVGAVGVGRAGLLSPAPADAVGVQAVGQAGRPGLLSPGPRLAFPPYPGPVPKGA